MKAGSRLLGQGADYARQPASGHLNAVQKYKMQQKIEKQRRDLLEAETSGDDGECRCDCTTLEGPYDNA